LKLFPGTTKLVYGRIVSNTFTAPKIETFPGYNMTIQEVPPLNGNGAHIHKNTEVFIFLTGKWEIGFGYDAQEKAIMKSGDLIVVPAYECRTYKNISDKPGLICTILAGESWVQFDQSVVEEARRYGAKCDDWGTLTHDDKGLEIENGLNELHASSFRDKEAFLITPREEMLRNMYRAPEHTGSRHLAQLAEGIKLNMISLNASTSARVPLGPQHTSIVVVKGRGLLQGIQVLDRFDTALVEKQDGISEAEFRLEGLEDRTCFLVVYSQGLLHEI